MSSATSPIRAVLEDFVAGRVKAERVVEAVAAAFYGEQGARSREQLRPLIEIIERAHPGTIELTGTAEKPGFGVRLAEHQTQASLPRSEEHTSELQSLTNLVCRLLLE